MSSGWGGDWHQHSESHSRNFLRHPIRQDPTVSGRVPRPPDQRLWNFFFFPTVSQDPKHNTLCNFSFEIRTRGTGQQIYTDSSQRPLTTNHTESHFWNSSGSLPIIGDWVYWLGFIEWHRQALILYVPFTHWGSFSALQVKLLQRRNTSESEWWVSHQRKLPFNACKRSNPVCFVQQEPKAKVRLLCCLGWPLSWKRGSRTSQTSPPGRTSLRWSIGPPPRCEFHLSVASLHPAPPSGGQPRPDINRQKVCLISPAGKKKHVTLAADELKWTTARLLVGRQLLCVFLLSSVFVQVRPWKCWECDSPAMTCCKRMESSPWLHFSPPFLKSGDANVCFGDFWVLGFVFFCCSNGQTSRGRKVRRYTDAGGKTRRMFKKCLLSLFVVSDPIEGF